MPSCPVGVVRFDWGQGGLESLGHRVDQARSYRRLAPLWGALCAAEPGVVLGRLSRFALDILLYRRIIEIWDARLRLRDHFDPDTRDAAWPDDATREAALLAVAIDAKQHGVTFPPGPVDEPPPDVAELVRVARAFHSSVTVRSAVEEAGRQWAQLESR